MCMSACMHVCVCMHNHMSMHTHPEHWNGTEGRGCPRPPRALPSPAGKIKGRALTNLRPRWRDPGLGATRVEMEDGSEEMSAKTPPGFKAMESRWCEPRRIGEDWGQRR